MNRTVTIIGVGSGLILLSLVLLPQFERAVEQGALHRLDHEGVAEWGLSPSPEHLRLVRQLREEPPAPPPLPSGDETLYQRFRADGVIQVGIYLEPPEKWERYSKWVGNEPGSPVRIRRLNASEALEDSFQNDDVVIVSGHSNFGFGLRVWNEGAGRDELWTLPGAVPAPGKSREQYFPKEKTVFRDFPEKGPPVLMLFGCRSSVYFSPPLIERYPDSHLVLTHYLWAPDNAFDALIASLRDALEGGKDLPALTEYWSALYPFDLLRGRSREQSDFGAVESELESGIFDWVFPLQAR